MLPNMDYSLIQRTPDGTGKILVTTPGSPDKGSFVLEADMKIYTNQGMVAIADIVDDLVTADAAKPLSANQGVVLKQLIDAFSGGIVPKGDILSSNLPLADASNKGWQYYCTDINQWATSDGTQWIMTSNNVITQTPDATDTGHALSNAVVTQCCNEVKGKLNQHESRLENLEQKAGDYGTWHYPNDPDHSSDMPNAVPTGKAKNGLVEKIVGKTRAWNQLVKNGNFADTSNWALNGTGTFTVSDGVASVTCDSANRITQSLGSLVIGHKYLVSYKLKFSVADYSGFSVRLSDLNRDLYIDTWEETTSWQTVSQIVSNEYISAGAVIMFRDARTTKSEFKFTDVYIRDLTLIFGAGNEPSTVADALAQLPALGEYNAYDAGSLVSTEVSGVKSKGVNIWDEEWESGILESDGTINSTSYPNRRTTSFIPVKPNTTYYQSSPSSAYLGRYAFYDSEKNLILFNSQGISSSTKTFETTSNTAFVRICFGSSYGTTYNHNIQICLNSYADKTIYHPYKTDTLSLSETVTLRGVGTCVETLDVETGVLDDGKFGLKNLGDYDWTQVGTGKFIVNDSDVASNRGSDVVPNIVCTKYSIITPLEQYQGTKTGITTGGNGVGSVGQIRVYDDSFTGDATAFKTAMSGVYLLYEKATYTPSDPIAPVTDNFIEVEGGGTVETIQTQTPVIDNCLDVGYLAV